MQRIIPALSNIGTDQVGALNAMTRKEMVTNVIECAAIAGVIVFVIAGMVWALVQAVEMQPL